METIDIALASDHGYFCGLLVTAVSMARHASREVALRFNVLDGGLTAADWEMLHEKLRCAHPHADVRRLVIDETRYATFPAWNCGSRMVYARLELADLLDEEEFVLYCDVDFLWQADVAELWALRDERVVLQGHPDGWELTRERENAWYAAQGLPFDFERYVCTGLLLINLRRYRQEALTAKVMAFLSEHRDVRYVDQTALNVVVPEKGILPSKWHRFSRDLRHGEEKGDWAIHFAGDLPWRCIWRAHALNDAAIAWHRFHGELTGVGTWGSLRMFFGVKEILFRRLLHKIVSHRVSRGLFFLLLKAVGHGGCIAYYQEGRR